MREWIEYHVRKCDIILPLMAIATPIEYVRNPLRVFELDFEENLRIVRYCVKYGKRLIFPSTSEVYGMCQDPEFDEQRSNFILGPTHKQRWIYSCSKQMLDRVIWAYGAENGLQFTLFRPFNWVGPKLDSLKSARIGSSRVITQFILNLVEGTPIRLVDGGSQKRCFTDVNDGIDCLFRIIENKGRGCDGRIFNIGNPDNEYSMQVLATHNIRATFFFSVGPDNMGRHLRRLIRPAFVFKMLRTGAPRLYGRDILLRGPLVAGPLIGEHCRDIIRGTAAAGHETGLHAWDSHFWQTRIERLERHGIAAEVRKGYDALTDILGRPPDCFAAPGWRVTPEALHALEQFPFRFESDCRGHPLFRPVENGRLMQHVQVPTTLPTYDELIGARCAIETYNDYLLEAVRPAGLNVLTIHAEVEGIVAKPLFERFFDQAARRGMGFCPLGGIAVGNRNDV